MAARQPRSTLPHPNTARFRRMGDAPIGTPRRMGREADPAYPYGETLQ